METAKQFKYWDIIVVAFVAVLLISNVASTKIVDFGWFTFDGGTLLFPLSYIFADIFTEVYGYSYARRAIWLGFVSAFVMSAVFIVVGKLPPATDWNNQAAYEAILGLTPRIVAASLLAYLAGNFSNSYILAKLKLKTQGKFLWVRTIGSTIVGEGLDTAIFCLVAFYGVLPGALLWSVIVSNYIFKVGVEVLFTPVTYRACSFLKKYEGVDVFDADTKFNPFKG
ncbi:MAG: transporter [Candidatus Magasanikbacteria bacterium RIFOXYD2_FULL_41_14]|uniref:Probable queuosine precursor transporter n=1 Tax=Candidatus Magasanikbacteria bacterium RIFOXYD2_FULL_41_14 TaxID=1798709 RepID=A0A1F6PCM3_9BACT|nr:MAG: transporter [Candidatus Magasanikbacteria bacterium RIFOXYD2_FULL_41_14]